MNDKSPFREFINNKLKKIDTLPTNKTTESGPGRIKKFFRTFILTRWLYIMPHCSKCGRELEMVNFSDLEPEVQKAHAEAGTDWVFYYGCVYSCPCEQGKDGKTAILMMR